MSKTDGQLGIPNKLSHITFDFSTKIPYNKDCYILSVKLIVFKHDV